VARARAAHAQSTGRPVRRLHPVEENLSDATLREVMGQFATGITVLTVAGDEGHGMTANAFTSVSLDPPLVLCCVARPARLHEAILSTGHFGVSVLGADQEHIARYFADRQRPRGAAQFESVAWLPGPKTGAPLLSGSLAWLECELTQVYHGGDHSIFLGEVLNSFRGEPGEALLFFGGKYHQVNPPAIGA
jgi:flavin reductase (DIM6/NTAB) family NADH-FMN oxidoreductase RutF